ncbi:hypothetical protein LINPERPRIM_LOCUS31300 [Linum perenne]
MSGKNFTDGARPALGDLTNQPLKRGFSSVYSDSEMKYVKGAEDSGFAKQVCLGVENSVGEKCQSGFKNGGDGTVKGILVKKDGKSHSSEPAACQFDLDGVGNVVSLLSDEPKVIEPSNPLDDGTNVIEKSNREIGDASGDSCGSSRTDSDDEVRTTYNVSLSQQSVGEVFGGSQGLTDESKDPTVDGLNGETIGLGESSRLLNSQSSKSFQLDRCTRLEAGDGCANREAGADFLKTCSCSFCLTAAFIWSDLHYQDIKGRLSSLKKSQKEASILVNKFSRGKQAEVHNQSNISKPLQLETDLTCQWRSLFQHMEDIFAQESNQIEKNFLALKDLRESCKTDLANTARVPPEN